MTTYEEAVRIVTEATQPLDTENIPLFESVGRVLAEDLFAGRDVPQTNRAAPDGYAVRSADIAGSTAENPAVLRIIGAVRAGIVPTRRVTAGTAMRIMTGSVVPDGADCIVRFEDTDEPSDKNGPNPADPRMVKIFVAEEAGSNIGVAGFSARRGSLLTQKGSLVGPTQLSALTTAGIETVNVIRRPLVAIITTGDELVTLGRPLAAGQVYNSNARAVAAAVTRFGGIPLLLGIARDKEGSLATKLEKAIKADAIVTTGGVSKGDYDIVRLLIGKVGKVLFSRISMGPGASVAFGLVNDASISRGSAEKPIFALAGPPSGALINCETLVRPGLMKMRGLQDLRHPSVPAEATDSVTRKMTKSFVRWTRLARTDRGFCVTLNPAEGVGPLASLASANSLTIIPQGVTVAAGETVEVLPLDWQGP